MLVLLKLISGNLSASKKFAPLRSLSRLSLPVSIDVVLLLNAPVDAAHVLVPARAADELLFLQPLEEARDARRCFDHPRGDLQSRQALSARPAQDAQHVVLLRGDAAKADDRAQMAADDVGGAQEG